MSPTAGIDSRELVAIGLNRKISQIDFNREALPDAPFENWLIYDAENDVVIKRVCRSRCFL
jgi:hypothetical protein